MGKISASQSTRQDTHQVAQANNPAQNPFNIIDLVVQQQLQNPQVPSVEVKTRDEQMANEILSTLREQPNLTHGAYLAPQTKKDSIVHLDREPAQAPTATNGADARRLLMGGN
jgi:hypothetical protein